MDYLRKVKIHDAVHYYLFHTETEPHFKKYKRYIGKTKPSDERLKTLVSKFLDDIKNNPEVFKHEEEKNIIEHLQDIQNKYGYVSEGHIVKLSKEMGIPAIDLYGVTTFYSQFKLVKPGKHKISVCRGTACHVKNSDSLLKHLEKVLQIKSGETTKDNLFTLECVNCIGACAQAPAIMIDGTVYGELTEDKLKKILEEFKQ